MDNNNDNYNGRAGAGAGNNDLAGVLAMMNEDSDPEDNHQRGADEETGEPLNGPEARLLRLRLRRQQQRQDQRRHRRQQQRQDQDELPAGARRIARARPPARAEARRRQEAEEAEEEDRSDNEEDNMESDVDEDDQDNNNNDINDDDEEEQDNNDDDDEDENEIDNEEGEQQGDDNEDNVIDGGMANLPGSETDTRSATLGDITLFLNCAETLFDGKHPILKQGVTVQIGMSKNTKLSSVFARYVQVCNEHAEKAFHESAKKKKNKKATKPVEPLRIEVDQLEFIHCHTLNESDTAEAAALMKNDRISVRKERSAERKVDAEREREQRESDKQFFDQLLQNLYNKSANQHAVLDVSAPHRRANTNPSYADTVLDCRGKIIENDDGHVQQVLSTTVLCHAPIVSKRCPWLGALISQARHRQAQKRSRKEEDQGVVVREGNAALDDGVVEDEMEVVPVRRQPNRHGNDAEVGPAAAQIENDEESSIQDSHNNADNDNSRGREGDDAGAESDTNLGDDDAAVRGASGDSLRISQYDHDPRFLKVTLEDHPPEAVKLLLQYIYTNRVIPLGAEAFVVSCRTKPSSKHHGPVPPYPTGREISRRWPNRGNPTVSFGIALATIRLAEEASMPRLSLMAEVAASKLVSASNFVEALTLCEAMKNKNGNPLVRLRKAAMDIVLRSGRRSVFTQPSFHSVMRERGATLVPTILRGTMDAVENVEKKKKSSNRHSGHHSTSSQCSTDWRTSALIYSRTVDKDDQRRRQSERRSRRLERLRNTIQDENDDEDGDPPVVKRLKRSHNI